MQYQSYVPSKLGGIVEKIWELEIQCEGKYTILPEGIVQLLFPLYQDVNIEAKKISQDENPMRKYSCFLSGLHTKPLKTNFNRFHTFGVQIRPVAVKAIFGMPLCEIRDYFVEGKIVLDKVRFIEDQLNSKSSFLERARWIENFLLKLIDETPDLHMALRLDQAIHNNLYKFNSSKKDLRDIMGYSRTQTYRLFNAWFGTSSHSYLKLMQFVRTVESLHNRAAKLGDIGLANGYYDQAHFIRDFRHFADMTPGAYRQQMSNFPGQLF